MNATKICVLNENGWSLISMVNFLEMEGFEVTVVDRKSQFTDMMSQGEVDIVILMMASQEVEKSGFYKEIMLKSLRHEFFLLLFSREKVDELIISALNAGADDILPYPIHNRVLGSRIRAILKRKKLAIPQEERAGLYIDQDRYAVYINNQEIHLPKKEFEILLLLNSKPDKVFSREEIMTGIWRDYQYVKGRTVDVHIRKIRKKIGDGFISTVKGLGYRLEVA